VTAPGVYRPDQIIRDAAKHGEGPTELATEVPAGSEADPVRGPNKRPKYYLREHLTSDRLAERGAVIHGAAAVEMLSRRLTEYIGAPEEDKYSYIWRSAIEDHEQDAHKDDLRAVLVDAVRDSVLGATSDSSPETSSAVQALLESPYSILVRVGIFACGEHYGNVGAVFCLKLSLQVASRG
jgi:hypothetical protein